mmetsp:Transcript_9466/g.26538  ORF Transcript_9466/g.26538 Transcript_9466/m.26538 type:complete len:269 (-) Transcript_9466:1357-2163(-)
MPDWVDCASSTSTPGSSIGRLQVTTTPLEVHDNVWRVGMESDAPSYHACTTSGADLPSVNTSSGAAERESSHAPWVGDCNTTATISSAATIATSGWGTRIMPSADAGKISSSSSVIWENVRSMLPAVLTVKEGAAGSNTSTSTVPGSNPLGMDMANERVRSSLIHGSRRPTTIAVQPRPSRRTAKTVRGSAGEKSVCSRDARQRYVRRSHNRCCSSRHNGAVQSYWSGIWSRETSTALKPANGLANMVWRSCASSVKDRICRGSCSRP